MKLLFLAQGPIEWPSSRYRAWWVAEAMPQAGCVQLDDALAAGSVHGGYDAVVFPKPCGPEVQALAQTCRARGQRVIWDVCDPVWWLRPREAREFLPLVDHIVVSSDGLAADLRHTLGWPSTVIPDRMKPAFHPTIKKHRAKPWPVLLWFGQSWNRLPSLSGALLTLHRLAAEGVRFRLRVLDDGAHGRDIQIDGVDVEYHRWHLETFHDELCEADVALTPAYPGPWGRMKSLNKQVSAWWAGLPTADGENPELLKLLLHRARFRAEVGLHNRRLAESRYDVAQSVREWEGLVAGRLDSRAVLTEVA
ncbi:MAG: hypothetical protein JXB47_12225 [Anaerolineae bacterium]|nr:hypothetical protein [Anaerolineae bacterium]